ncbi:hypothetical protein [Clostridium aquiflavi]|uniref:Uncharacterized protein n=1 Tax=Clostridium aquiflavi TaxID=3073603 RepID=A0ABU1EDB6_9CLOT|nr:hypothetical protein [Clostridium sp. 5N-1]MDR5586366.1 hypothetical protein [Clostridium sp. 5N-1]
MERNLSVLSQTKDLKITKRTEGDKSNNKESYLGVFKKVENPITKAIYVQKKLSLYYTKEDRERIIKGIRKATLENKEILAKMIVDETHMGRYEDKILKHELVDKYTPGTEGFTTFTIAGPTGEVIASARNFTKQRRCVLAG